jgi:hypothetical protein
MKEDRILTQDYIEGSQDMLSSLTKQLNKSIARHADGTPNGTVKGLNEFITYLYLKQDTVEDMIYELAKIQEFEGDPFDEQACTEEAIPSFYVVKSGRLFPVYKGGV